MILDQTLDKDNVGNGLKERVTACRKRLRINRTMLKALVQNEPDEGIAESTVLVSELHRYPPEYLAMRKYLICNNYCSLEFEGTRSGETESFLLVGEQEVGIT